MVLHRLGKKAGSGQLRLAILASFITVIAKNKNGSRLTFVGKILTVRLPENDFSNHFAVISEISNNVSLMVRPTAVATAKSDCLANHVIVPRVQSKKSSVNNNTPTLDSFSPVIR